MRTIFRLSFVLCILLCVLSVFGAGCNKNQNYTLTIAVTGNGTVVPEVGTHIYAAGTVVTLKATPEAGYTFDSWSGPDGTSVSTKNTIVMDKKKLITAVFSKL